MEVYFVYNITQPQHDLLVRMWMTQHRAFVLANIVEVYFVYNITQPQHDLLVRMWMTQHRAFVLRQELLNDIFREYHIFFIQPCDSCFKVEKSPD